MIVVTQNTLVPMKNRLILIAIIGVALASAAYAAFATNLSTNGTGTATGLWDVAITSISPASQDGASDRPGTPSFTSTSATFDVDLAYPGASSSYQVVIKNRGNIDAKLSSLTDLSPINAAVPTYLTYTLSGISVGDTLAPNATVTVTVTVSWTAGAGTAGVSKSATINFNYIQNT